MNHWGKSIHVDLVACNHHQIVDPDYIRGFASDIVEFLDMEAFGPPIIERFGKDDKQGYTLVQLIQTSNIIAHFVDCDNTAYFEVFSCKDFDHTEAAYYCADYFGGKVAKFWYHERG